MAMETNAAARGEALLDVKDLNIRFKGKRGTVSAVEHLDFSIRKGELLALVGESGCGKSVTSLAVMDLIERPGEVQAAQMLLNGKDLTKLSAKEKRKLRGTEMAMIFQDPLTSLNPLFTVGNQISEQFLTHIPGCTKQQAKEKSIEIIRKTGIPRPEAVYNSYPHEVVGRHAPARDDRHRAELQPQAADRRRADHGARRDHSGADSAPDAGSHQGI